MHIVLFAYYKNEPLPPIKVSDLLPHHMRQVPPAKSPAAAATAASAATLSAATKAPAAEGPAAKAKAPAASIGVTSSITGGGDDKDDIGAGETSSSTGAGERIGETSSSTAEGAALPVPTAARPGPQAPPSAQPTPPLLKHTRSSSTPKCTTRRPSTSLVDSAQLLVSLVRAAAGDAGEGNGASVADLPAMDTGDFVQHLVRLGRTLQHVDLDDDVARDKTLQDVVECTEQLESRMALMAELDTKFRAQLARAYFAVTNAHSKISMASTRSAQSMLEDPLSRLCAVFGTLGDFLEETPEMQLTSSHSKGLPGQAEIRSRHTLEHTHSAFQARKIIRQRKENEPRVRVCVRASVSLSPSLGAAPVDPLVKVTIALGVCGSQSHTSENCAEKEVCPICTRPISRKATKGCCMGTGKCSGNTTHSGAEQGVCSKCNRPISRKATRGCCMGKGKCAARSTGGVPLEVPPQMGSIPPGLPPLIFFGGPGTGKTFELNRLRTVLQNRLPEGACALVAMYGVVAQRIGGQTLASWAGTGTGEGSVDEWEVRVRANPRATSRILSTQALLLDDWSPEGAHNFSNHETVVRRIRNNDLFFGGIWVCGTVDFLQILSLNQPPLWMAPKWSSVVIPEGILVHFNEQHRFGNREDARLLERVRTNQLQPADICRIQSLSANEESVEQLEPLHLFPKVDEVSKFHSDAAAKIEQAEPGRILRYKSLVQREGTVQLITSEQAEQRFITGTRIMFRLNNLNGHRTQKSFTRQPIFANGTLGRVVDRRSLVERKARTHDVLKLWLQHQGTFELPVVTLDDDPTTQYVLEPIWFDPESDGSRVLALPAVEASAITIHKSLGTTLPAAVVHLQSLKKTDIASNFIRHLVYEALSRCKSMDCLCVKGFEQSLIVVDREAVEAMATLEQHAASVEVANELLQLLASLSEESLGDVKDLAPLWALLSAQKNTVAQDASEEVAEDEPDVMVGGDRNENENEVDRMDQGVDDLNDAPAGDAGLADLTGGDAPTDKVDAEMEAAAQAMAEADKARVAAAAAAAEEEAARAAAEAEAGEEAGWEAGWVEEAGWDIVPQVIPETAGASGVAEASGVAGVAGEEAAAEAPLAEAPPAETEPAEAPPGAGALPHPSSAANDPTPSPSPPPPPLREVNGHALLQLAARAQWDLEQSEAEPDQITARQTRRRMEFYLTQSEAAQCGAVRLPCKDATRSAIVEVYNARHMWGLEGKTPPPLDLFNAFANAAAAGGAAAGGAVAGGAAASGSGAAAGGPTEALPAEAPPAEAPAEAPAGVLEVEDTPASKPEGSAGKDSVRLLALDGAEVIDPGISGDDRTGEEKRAQRGYTWRVSRARRRKEIILFTQECEVRNTRSLENVEPSVRGPKPANPTPHPVTSSSNPSPSRWCPRCPFWMRNHSFYK